MPPVQSVPFPIAAAAPTSTPPSIRRDCLLLLILCAAVFGAGLGFAPLANPDEARYAEIPREMLASGDFVTPRLDGVKYFEKPPLTYWLVAGSLEVFGSGEAAARAVPAAIATLGVLLTYLAGRRLGGRDAAWWAAIVLATSIFYIALARILLTDMVVSIPICAGLFCFALAVREPAGPRRRALFLGLYASAALATLAKGLIGFLLPGAVMFFWLLLFNQWRRLLPFYLPTGLLLFAAIAVPWHVLVAQRNPEWAWFYFVHEHWLRFTTTTHGRSEPWWFFLAIVVPGFFPWTGFLPSALRAAWPESWARRAESADKFFPLLWAGFILLFFSASQSKLAPYALPAFPPLAWLIGQYLAPRMTRLSVTGLRGGLATFSIVSCVLGLALLAIYLRPSLLGSVANRDELAPFAMLAGVFLLGGGLGVAFLVRADNRPAALYAMFVSTAAFMAVVILATPAIARPSTKELARVVAREIDPGDIVLHYHDFYHDFCYYSGHTVGTVGYQGELELFLDPAAAARGPHVTEARFHELWAGKQQVFLVLTRADLDKLRAAPGSFACRVLAETRKHVVVVNRL